MTKPRALPKALGRRFTVGEAAAAGVNRGRLRRKDLLIPFRGVRSVGGDHDVLEDSVFATQAAERRIQARRYAPRLLPGQFFSHETAVALRGGPLPLIVSDGVPVDGRALPVHVSTLGSGPLVRAEGVQAHRANPPATQLVTVESFDVSTAAISWAEMGATLSVPELVALGDYFCRVWRVGVGRQDAGAKPWADVDALRQAISRGRRVGIARLREAVDLVREDSWSPRESHLRVAIVTAGLPEPLLNQDVFDARGRFLGCFDLVYPEQKVVIEYHGLHHAGQYAADVERIAALRAAGWIVIEVTNELFRHPEILIARIRAALGY